MRDSANAVLQFSPRREPIEAASDLEAYEDLIFEAIERLARIEALTAGGRFPAVRRIAGDLASVARRLGLPSLARVATDLSKTEDEHAAAAISARLLRLGESCVAAAIAPGPRFR